MDKAIKFYKRIAQDVYHPHSCSLKERDMLIRVREGAEAWCKICESVIDNPEKRFPMVCPFCGNGIHFLKGEWIVFEIPETEILSPEKKEYLKKILMEGFEGEPQRIINRLKDAVRSTGISEQEIEKTINS